MLNNIPLFTAVLGVLFLVAVVGHKGGLGGNRPAWFTLILIVVFAIHAQLDAYLFFNGFDSSWIGFSLLHYHLMGGLFLFFAHYLLRVDVDTRKWMIVLLSYTVLRVVFLIPEDSTAYENYSDDLNWVDAGIVLDAFVSNGLNIAGLLIALSGIKRLDFAVQPDKRVQIYYLWLKNLLTILIGIYAAIVVLTIVSFFFEEQWLIFWKIEAMISGFFFFILGFFAIRFPIFSVYGDFRDLDAQQRKYAKSSLKDKEADEIWSEINRLMISEKLYQNPEYRLNELAERVDKSMHHVSQVINQKQGGSFSDFLNAFRIEEAKKVLKSDKANQLTILAIALDAGFNSKTAFYNAFKKSTGQTPSQFIKEQR